MPRRVTHERAECPVARAVDVIGDRWSLLIIRDAFDGISRFSEFRRNLGLAKNILAARLRELVTQGILEVVPATDGTAYHEYVLTDKGRDLFTILVGLRQWGEDHLFDATEQHSVLLDAKLERPLGRLQVTDSEGHALTPPEAFVRKVSRQ
ncbi:winged helix-turn-helix transcriptional regulator [Phytoactinopolyspora mesophila]|uniref:Transcriptional regulator n=1 Tax=Phytoactinopolyspora mesophila TaxID=2650750 RepID=A0A7K3M9Q0_9ACTN|nr:helix-turn-helix domain-containing protein [Phytoactinopolyspora mesophila]NDL60071.1 transcriptional regulator [Phytoactinopolyspora mesophila]